MPRIATKLGFIGFNAAFEVLKGRGGLSVQELNRMESTEWVSKGHQAVCKSSQVRAGERGGALVGNPRWAKKKIENYWKAWKRSLGKGSATG